MKRVIVAGVVFFFLSGAVVHALGAWTVVGSPNVGKGHNELFGVAAVSPDDVWAVGSSPPAAGPSYARAPLILRSNGKRWSVVPSPLLQNANHVSLRGVFAAASDDVWAVGNSGNVCCIQYNTLIEHWNGSSWSIVPSPNGPRTGYNENTLTAISGTSGADIWAVGDYKTDYGYSQTLILHYDGLSWKFVPSPNMTLSGGALTHNVLRGISARASDDVWAVGYWGSGSKFQTLVLHWDGIRWSILSSPAVSAPNVPTVGTALEGVLASSPSDAWAIGYERIPYLGATADRPMILRWDGSKWNVVTHPLSYTLRANLYGIWGVSSSDIWAAGEKEGQTLILHWDGTSWSVVSSPNAGTSNNGLRAVSGVSSSHAFAVGAYLKEKEGILQTLTLRYAASSPAPRGASTPEK